MGFSMGLTPLFYLEDLREMNLIELFIQEKVKEVNPDLQGNVERYPSN
jgi:hypothetical protein